MSGGAADAAMTGGAADAAMTGTVGAAMADAADAAMIDMPTAPKPAGIPWLGLTGVLLATFLSTLNGRLSSFGLADVRGAVHAGFDEGAWITTAQTVAQMLIAPTAMWCGMAFGPRRPLIYSSAAFAVISLLKPWAGDLPALLALQFAGGIASGFFVPLTLGFVLRSLPPKAWAYGIALYALNLELSSNVSASLEGWYVDQLSWRWIFWQSVPLSLAMMLCLAFGTRPDPAPPQRPPVDAFGLVAGGVGLALIYAALDQGNRVDWLNSGMICGLLLAGGLLVAGFMVHEARTARPLVNYRVALAPTFLTQLLLVGFLRLTILATAFVIPQYLSAVRGFKSLETGQALIWIAAPQLLLCALAGYALRRADARLVAAFGFLCIAVACLFVAYGLTPLWGSAEFLPSQLLEAVGQSFAVSGIVFFGVLHIRLEDALTFGTVLQTARLMGGEIGQAFVVTYVRMREQVASNLLGLHVRAGDDQVVHRLRAYAAATTKVGGPSAASDRAATLLGLVVRSAATTQSIIDAFVAIALLTVLGLLLLVARNAAPVGPASHRPLFGARETEP
jgi:DHA2 family multidrug resistance protein